MTRAIGLLLGLGLVALAVLAGRVAGGHAPAGSAVSVTAVPTGELGLSRTGVILEAPDLHPGAAAVSGDTAIRNQTARTLAVRVRALSSRPDLDRLLMVHIEQTGLPPTNVPLGALSRWGRRSMVLRPGETGRLALRLWLPAGVRDGYQGRIVDVRLDLRSVVLA